MKKLKLTLAVLILTATVSFAQTKTRVERRDSVITNIMKLDEPTKAKFMAFLDENAEGNKAIKKDVTLSEEQKKEKIKAYKKEMDAKLITIITPEQKKVWRRYTEEEKNRSKN